MPYLVTCPNCASKLKSANPVAAGKSVACPQCKTTFKLSEPAPEIDAPAAAPARPAPASTPAPRTSRSERPAPARRDDDEDERPRSRRRDDDEDRPRRRRDEDEEDERPRGRRRPADDDEEDRPKSRRRRDEDEDEEEKRPRSRRRPADTDEDERPRGRRSRDEDEEEQKDRRKSRKARAAADDDDEEADDDRPRRRGRGKKKSKKGLVLILGALAALLLLGIGGVGFMYFVWDPLGLFGGGSSEMLAWAPSDSQALMYMDIEEMEKVNEMKGTLKGEVVDQAKLGLKPEDVSAFLGAARGQGEPDVTVIKLRSKADQQKLISASGGKEAMANGKKYYKTNAGGGLYFASDKMLVVTKTETSMTALLQKDNKVTISDDLRVVSKKGDGLMWMAATGPAAEKGDMIGLFSIMANPAAAFGMGGPKMSGPKAKSTLMSVKMSGGKATGRFESTYDSSDSAKRIADDLKKVMDQAKGKSAQMESFDVSMSGSTVTLTIVGPMKAGKGGMPGLPFGPAGGF